MIGRACRADFSPFRSAAFRTGSPLISARRKSCRLVTRSSDNVRRKPGVPTYPHLDRFPVSRDLYRQKGARIARSCRASRVVRSRKSERKPALLRLIRSARIIFPAATRRGTIRPRRFYAAAAPVKLLFLKGRDRDGAATQRLFETAIDSGSRRNARELNSINRMLEKTLLLY